jgi:hypothetical protein
MRARTTPMRRWRSFFCVKSTRLFSTHRARLFAMNLFKARPATHGPPNPYSFPIPVLFRAICPPIAAPLRIRSRTLICFPTDRPLGESMFVIIRSNARRDQSSVRLFRRLIAFHRFTAFALFYQGNLLRRLRRIRTLRLFDRR